MFWFELFSTFWGWGLALGVTKEQCFAHLLLACILEWLWIHFFLPALLPDTRALLFFLSLFVKCSRYRELSLFSWYLLVWGKHFTTRFNVLYLGLTSGTRGFNEVPQPTGCPGWRGQGSQNLKLDYGPAILAASFGNTLGPSPGPEGFPFTGSPGAFHAP